MQQRKTLTQLFIPIALETLFMMLTGMVDTLMLSAVGDAAVGAVGTANTYLNMFLIAFGVISSGMGAVVTQFIGAGRQRAAGQTLFIGLGFNAVIGGILSAGLFFLAKPILHAAGTAPMLFGMSEVYLKIIGGCCFIPALINVLSSYLRAFGYTRQSLYATLAANTANVFLNALFLFGLNWGVAGVAWATVISRVGNLVFLVLFAFAKIHTDDGTAPMPTGLILKQMIRIGLPAAFETALYNVASALTVRFLNQMDAEGLHITARTYAQQLASFCLCGSAALAQANGLITGWLVGAGSFDECRRKTNRAAGLAILMGSGTAAVLALASPWLLRLFTDDTVLIGIASKLMLADIALEIGRAGNLVYGNALKVSGDSIFPSVIGAIFMYLLMVGGGWYLGINRGMLSLGIFIASAADECTRAVCMCIRWQSGKWKSKGIIKRQ